MTCSWIKFKHLLWPRNGPKKSPHFPLGNMVRAIISWRIRCTKINMVECWKPVLTIKVSPLWKSFWWGFWFGLVLGVLLKIYFRKKRKRGRGRGERGKWRMRENLKQAPCLALSLTQCSIPGPWDHDLNWNPESATWPTEPPRHPGFLFVCFLVWWFLIKLNTLSIQSNNSISRCLSKINTIIRLHKNYIQMFMAIFL